SPRGAIAAYLRAVEAEARARGYAFDVRKISGVCYDDVIPVTRGQVAHEWEHLLTKPMRKSGWTRGRAIPAKRAGRPGSRTASVPGGIEPWERGGNAGASGRPARTPGEAPRSRTPRVPPAHSPA